MSPSLFSSSFHPPNAEIPKESALCPDIFLPHPPLLSLQTSPLKMMPITLSGCLHSISHRNATGTLNLGSPKPIHSPPKPTAFLHSLSWRKMSSSALAANLASVFFLFFPFVYLLQATGHQLLFFRQVSLPIHPFLPLPMLLVRPPSSLT